VARHDRAGAARGPAPAPLVVIVEDDPAIAEGLALNLKLLGYRSEVIPDAETARTRISEGRPDLVLLDITLPKQSASGCWSGCVRRTTTCR